MCLSLSLSLSLRCFGTRKSLREWNNDRLSRSFESVDDAEIRTKKNKEKVLDGTKKTKNHCGSFEKMAWDKEGLKSYEADKEVNWLQLSLKYGIKDGKGMFS